MTPNEIVEQAPKDTVKASGIYMIYCMPANKAYIGQSKNIHRRWIHHRHSLKENKHGNIHLQNLYNKYGKDSLSFYVLENSNELAEREAHYLDLLDSDKRVNLAAVLEIFPCSDETRKKIS